jgi:hypothetical protein
VFVTHDIAEAQARAQIARDNARKAAIEVQIKELELAKKSRARVVSQFEI